LLSWEKSVGAVGDEDEAVGDEGGDMTTFKKWLHEESIFNKKSMNHL